MKPKHLPTNDRCCKMPYAMERPQSQNVSEVKCGLVWKCPALRAEDAYWLYSQGRVGQTEGRGATSQALHNPTCHLHYQKVLHAGGQENCHRMVVENHLIWEQEIEENKTRTSEKKHSFGEASCLSGQTGAPLTGEAWFCSQCSGHVWDWGLTKMSAQQAPSHSSRGGGAQYWMSCRGILKKVMRREIKKPKEGSKIDKTVKPAYAAASR